MQEGIEELPMIVRGVAVPIKRLHSLRSIVPALVCVLVLSLLGACSSESPPTTPSRRPNFILIVADALRADRLHYAGYPKDLSPNFDDLQNQSTSFPNAYAPSSWTIPSMASVFLSQLPSKHKVVHWVSSARQEQTTFVDKLREAGYRTGAWTANPMMDKNRGFARRFDDYHVVRHDLWRQGLPPESEFSFAPASKVTSEALAWLREVSTPDSDVPFFAYLHYMEPHTPLLCADSAGDRCRLAAAVLTKSLVSTEWDFDWPERELIQALYGTGVVRMDAELGHLYREINASGLLKHTWVILTADHGEMLGEQDFYLHGDTLYQASLRVPLLISSPSRGRLVVDSPVSLIDLGPTILDLAGVEAPASFSGRSLRRALEGGALPLRPVVSELFPPSNKPKATHRHVLAVTNGTAKILVGVDGKLERFNLNADPQELEPVPANSQELDEFLSEVGMTFNLSDALSAPSSEISPEVRQQLRSLGYVQ